MILLALFFTSSTANCLYWFGSQLIKLNREDSLLFLVFVILAYNATFFMPQLAMNKSLLYSVEQRTQMMIKASENLQTAEYVPQKKYTSYIIDDDSTVEDHQDDAISLQHQALMNHLRNGGETYEERQSIMYRKMNTPEY